jgi:UDP-glucose 4-epimerase
MNSVNKKLILVTGGAGYIGSQAALALIENGYDVVIFDSLENGHKEIVGAVSDVKAPGKIVAFIQGDLKNINDISKIFENRKIDAVLHFAAYIQVEESVANPQKYYRNNIGGTLNLLSTMLENSINKIVFSSTAAVYGEPKYIPIDEIHSQNPINPYGWSKMIVEKILCDYSDVYGLKSATLRYFNVAGADTKTRIGEMHEPETHLIPNVLMAASDSEKVFQLYGNDFDTRDGTCVRDYVNVEDLAEAHVLALQYLLNGGDSDCFNLGTNDGNTVNEVFDACERITQGKIRRKINTRRAGDPAVLVACNKRARKILGWSPKRTIDDSIRTAYSWTLKMKEIYD